MLLKFEIDSTSRKDVVEAGELIQYLKSTFVEINKVVENVAKERNLDPNILAQGLQAAVSSKVEESIPSDVNEAPQPPVGQPQGVELDSEGLPWDHRIHASSKKKLAKTGAWKLMRGVDQSLVDSVKTELRAVMNVPAPQPEAVAPVAPPVPKPQVIPPAPQPEAVAPVAPPAHSPSFEPAKTVTFPEFMTAVTEAGLDESEITEACNSHGVESLYLLAARPDLITPVYNELFS